MLNKKQLVLTSIMLIVSITLSSCALFPTQKMIDNIVPDYETRMYTVADLIPYTEKEIRNSLALYTRELIEFFEESEYVPDDKKLFSKTQTNSVSKNGATSSVAKQNTKEGQDAFITELLYRMHNKKIIDQRRLMYEADEKNSKETKVKQREDEFDKYYKLKNASGINTIKNYNKGKAEGMPFMSIRVILSTATVSSVDDITSEAMCEIYDPSYITNDEYEKLKINDEIVIKVPATNSTVDCKVVNKLKCKYIATDSLLYIDENGRAVNYYIAAPDGTNVDKRRLLDEEGKTLETYVETKPLQFMKYARASYAIDQYSLLSLVSQDAFMDYDFHEIAIRAMGGGFVAYEYMDYVYANSIGTNKKGYITQLTDYSNQRTDKER